MQWSMLGSANCRVGPELSAKYRMDPDNRWNMDGWKDLFSLYERDTLPTLIDRQVVVSVTNRVTGEQTWYNK